MTKKPESGHRLDQLVKLKIIEMRKIFIFLITVSLCIDCKNRESEEFIKASQEASNQNSEFDKIANEFKNENAKVKKKYNGNNQKEILNKITQEQDFFSSDKIDYTRKKLNEAKDYYESIFKENNAIYKKTLDKLNILKDRTKNSEVYLECTLSISYIKTLQVNLQMYKIHVDKLIDLIASSSKYVGKDCKYIIKNGEVLFYEDDCLNKYNKLIKDVQKSQIECNNYRQKIIDIKI